VPVIEQVSMTKCSPWQYPEAQSFTFLIQTDSYGLFLQKVDSHGKCFSKAASCGILKSGDELLPKMDAHSK